MYLSSSSTIRRGVSASIDSAPSGRVRVSMALQDLHGHLSVGVHADLGGEAQRFAGDLLGTERRVLQQGTRRGQGIRPAGADRGHPAGPRRSWWTASAPPSSQPPLPLLRRGPVAQARAPQVGAPTCSGSRALGASLYVQALLLHTTLGVAPRRARLATSIWPQTGQARPSGRSHDVKVHAG